MASMAMNVRILMKKKSMPSMALRRMENHKALMKPLPVIDQMRMTVTLIEI